jgi:hypothetical protein
MPRRRLAFRLVRQQGLAVRLGLLLLLAAGCNPKPKLPDSLQEKLNEGAFVQAKVDLLIAKADLEAIENDQYRLDSAHKGWEQRTGRRIRSTPIVSSRRWTSSAKTWTRTSTGPRGIAMIGSVR